MSQRLTIGLCQINAGFSGASYLPYSAGLLEAYARKSIPDIDRFEFLIPIFTRESINSAVEKLLPANVAGFSLYVWNNQLSLAIAKELKARKPEITIVVGGPHVPDRYKSHIQNKQMPLASTTDLSSARIETYLKDHPFIDIAVHGEGERPFSLLLQNISGDWRKIPSISYLDQNRCLIETERLARINNLNEIPSPYLEGAFDPLMAAHSDINWITVWETNRGCPFSCTFCDWGSVIASKVYKWEVDRIYKEIDWFADHKVEFTFLADANFGILPRDIEIAKYCAEARKRTGYPTSITVSNTKNATDRSYEVQKIFSDAGLASGASISMQSMDPTTLKDIKRDNISLDSYQEIQQRMKLEGIASFTDIVLGLPSETYDSFTNGINQLIKNGLHDRIRFYNLTILPNAEMANPDYQKRFGMETVCAKIINIHGTKKEIENDVPELENTVIATASMPRKDWIRARAFSWTVGFLHFDKILQIPLVLMHELTGISYRDLIEFFSEGNFGSPAEFPVLEKVRSFFADKAQSLQEGHEEFCHSLEWLDMW
ncbi:MAG: radical SAM protein, partial [bacterium]|nr:radical SAM protein [bacterium]